MIDSNDIVPSNELVLETANDLESELAKFRNEWKSELSKQEARQQQQIQTGKSDSKLEFETVINVSLLPILDVNSEAKTISLDLEKEESNDNEEKAQYLFNKGVLLEQQGRHFEAIKFYRMSIQLDANIEFKISSNRASVNKSGNQKDTQSQENDPKTSETDDVISSSLFEQFEKMTLLENRICEKNFPQKATHFSQLPLEVIMLILKWVVSSHLDMRSLDAFSAVCKGFYVMARDPEIWKLACAKIWGENNIENCLKTYCDWREMFLKRPRLNFDGVYISRTSYARAGEQSLDNLYRPWHLVEYFRYLRFFPDGTVLFLTTPDEPKQTVAKLKIKSPANTSSNYPQYSNFIMNEHSILKGTWSLALNKVSIVLCKKIFKPKSFQKYSRKMQNNKEAFVDQDQIFRVELELSGKLNTQLHWFNYEIQIINKIANTKSFTKFDLNKVDFPPLYYSRVKSYSTMSESQLK